MLDLQQITATKKLYEIKMIDGKVLKLKMPSQKLFQDLIALQAQMDNPVEAISAIYDILAKIFNQNTEGLVYKANELSDTLDLNTAILVMKDYLENTTKTLGE